MVALKALVISDVHDNIDNLLKVMRFTSSRRDLSYIFHCGDLVSPFTASILSKHKPDNVALVGVWGNNDGDRETIMIKLGEESVFENILIKEINGKRTLVLHGAESIDLTEMIIKSLLKSLDYDLIFFGHTHLPKIITCNRINRELVDIPVNQEIKEKGSRRYSIDLSKYAIALNPGELCGYLNNTPTFALISLRDSVLEVDYIRISDI